MVSVYLSVFFFVVVIQVVINCEFGGFGDNGCLGFIKTDIDYELDKYSNHPGSYT